MLRQGEQMTYTNLLLQKAVNAQVEVNRLVYALNEAQRSNGLGWIPVTEALPDDDDLVLVTCQSKNGTRSVNRAYYDGQFWHGSGSMAGVTAWMPLPEPYEEVRRDG